MEIINILTTVTFMFIIDTEINFTDMKNIYEKRKDISIEGI